jgi:hypothetical protein
MKVEVVEGMVASVEGNGRKGGRDEGIVLEGLATTKASRLACRVSYLLLTAQWRVIASRFRRRGSRVPYGEDSAVLIGLRGMCLMGTHLTGACISWACTSWACISQAGLRRKSVPMNSR